MAITATFEANFDQFVTAVKKALQTLDEIKDGATKFGTALTASLASTELRRFARDVKGASTVFIEAFAEEEAAVKTLTVALQNQGNLTPAVMAQYAELATAFQKTTVFSDDLIISMEALLVQVGDVAPEQMQAALTAATNLSAGLGIDLQAATLALAKGFEGGTTALLKMVPSLKGVIKEGATMEEVLGIINERFGGQAQAQIETTTGKFALLSNQMSDVKEQIGEVLVNALNPLLQAFTALPQSMQTTIVAVVAIGTALAPVAVSFAALSTILAPLIPLIGTAFFGALSALIPLIGPAGLIIVGATLVYAAFKNWDQIAGIAQGVYDGLRTWLVDRFSSIVSSVRGYVDSVTGFFRGMYDAVVGHSIVPDMVDGIGREMGRLQSVMVEPAAAAASATVTVFSDMAASVGQAMQSVAAAVSGGGAAADGYRHLSSGSSGSGGFQLGVPLDFGYAAAYRKAGYFVHDSPFLGKDIFDSPGAFSPRSGGVNIYATFNGILDPAGRAQLSQIVSDEMTRAVLQGRKVAS